ncbi:MAG: alpha/beta fold hydrolase [Anaerolineae bacterium]
MTKRWDDIPEIADSSIYWDREQRQRNLIVFAHGYTGHPDDTWRRFPRLLLEEDLGFAETYELASFGYETGRFTNETDLEGLTDAFRSFLKAYADSAERIILITHSLGGLLARRLLVALHDSAFSEERKLFEHIQQVHFLGVPHQGAIPSKVGGSALAKAAALAKPFNYLGWEISKDSPVLAATLQRWMEILEAAELDGNHLPVLYNYVGDRDWVAPLAQVMGDVLWKLERYDLVPGEHGEIPKPRSSRDITFRLIQQAIQGLAPAPDPARRQYLERLRSFCQSLPLTAMGKDVSKDDVILDNVYIAMNTTARFDIKTGRLLNAENVQPQDARQPLLESADDRNSLMHERDPERLRPFTALEAALEYGHLVIKGDPGSGKSTFVKQLISIHAQAELHAGTRSGLDPRLLPIYVTLRDLAERVAGLQETLEDVSGDKRRVALARAMRDQVIQERDDLDEGGGSPLDLSTLADGRCLLVLDGIDEVPPSRRALLRETIMSAIKVYRVERVIATCRVLSYSGDARLEGFTDFELDGLTRVQIQSFSHRWYEAQARLVVPRYTLKEAQDRGDELAEAAMREDLVELAKNPLLLTTMAIVHQRSELPRDRVVLFKKAIEVLLLRWQEHKVGRGKVAPSKELVKVLSDNTTLYRCMQGLAYSAHCARRDSEAANPPGEQRADRADLTRSEALRLLEGERYLDNAGLASAFLDYVDTRAGLLIGRGGEDGKPDVYGFPHRQFQEYLAGCHLIGTKYPHREYVKHAKEGDFWTQATLLAAEELRYGRGDTGINALLELTYGLAACDTDDPQQVQRAALWSGTCASLLGTAEIARDGEGGGPAYLEHIKPKLVTALSGVLPALERAAAGRVLAALGDERDEVMTLEGMRFCGVPAGRFWMGAALADHDADGDEKPGGWYDVAYPYWIGFHPVSNAQFLAFATAGGYTDPRWWPEAKDAGLWTAEGFRVANEPGATVLTRPIEMTAGPFSLPNHPVMMVSWYEAVAYTRWLTELAQERGWLAPGWSIRLPNEPEWEKAARGGESLPKQPRLTRLADLASCAQEGGSEVSANPTAQRIYPWGDVLEGNFANYGGTAIGSTSALGCFPDGTSPYGAMDLCGNVWEWTRSLWGMTDFNLDFPYPYERGDGREDALAPFGAARVVRGGSWFYVHLFARASSRLRYPPGNRLDDLGFRLVVSSPISPVPLAAGAA